MIELVLVELVVVEVVAAEEQVVVLREASSKILFPRGARFPKCYICGGQFFLHIFWQPWWGFGDGRSPSILCIWSRFVRTTMIVTKLCYSL